MTAFKTLKTVQLGNSDQITSSENVFGYNLESPASVVITNFKKTRPAVLEPDLSVDQALMVMRKSHVRSVIVVDKSEKFMGLLTLADLESRKVLAMAEQMGSKRADLTVRDLMTSKSSLLGIPIADAEAARIGDMLRTLQDLGKPHILLTSESGEITGIVSASELARKLQIDINISEKVTSFSEIYGVVSKGREI